VIAGPVKRGSVPDHLYWDTAEPYHYVRLNPWRDDKDILVAGGEDHRSGEADDAERRFAKLKVWTHERFPELEDITYRWSGQVLDTPDFAAFIGRNPGSERTYVVSGDSGQGITHGAAAGMMLTSLILDRRS
jgi:glycine/D-amino acid oxidase-like deaminating enzyme